MKERRQYSEELRAEAIRMVVRESLSLAGASKKLGIPKGTIASWMSKYQESTEHPLSGTPSVAELLGEVTKLRKELIEVKMEREILKKATAYFAKESLPSMRS
jgi:transposase